MTFMPEWLMVVYGLLAILMVGWMAWEGTHTKKQDLKPETGEEVID